MRALHALGLVAAVVVGPRMLDARVLPGDAFLCADARPPRAPRGGGAVPIFHSRVGVTVIDRFTRPLPSERYTLDLEKAEAYCRPVRIDDAELADPLSGFEAYAARRTRRKPAPPSLPVVTESIETSFGSVALRVGGVAALQVPTLATGSVGGSGPERDHFACYDVRAERGADLPRGVLRVVVRDADGRRTVEVRKPARLCVPASVRADDPGAPKHPLDLLCFDARLARTEAALAPVSEPLATRNAFGNELLKIGATRLLCVPAARSDVVVPTATPFPTLTPLPSVTPTPTPVPTPRVATLRIDSPVTTALVHDRVCVAALLERPDGSTVDVTATVNWRIGDGRIAAPAGVDAGRKCFRGTAIGRTDLIARDATLGIASAPAPLEYEWPIFRIEVAPKRVGLRIGEGRSVTAQAFFTGNRTRNVTQYARYVSGDEAVARAPNATGNRSRVEGAGAGVATVIVQDELSSLFDSFAVAVGTLETLRVEEVGVLFPGDHAHLQATGVFSGGFASNYTQDVAYESSDPTVVAASNEPDDRNRIDALQPGVATVTATDPATGIRSTCCGKVSVVGAALDVAVLPAAAAHRKDVGGDALAFGAVGLFAIPPVDRAYVPATERLLWSVSPPGVVALGPLVAGKQTLTVVGAGDATLVATDPGSGRHGSAAVAIYDRLDRVDVGTDRDDPSSSEERTLVIGESAAYFAHGWFDGVRYRGLDDVELAADPPDVVAVQGNLVVGLHPGTATIAAIDRPTGIGSTATGGRNAVVHVVGAVARLVLSPAAVTMAVGESRTLTALAERIGGGNVNYTQRVAYASSDPAVVAVPNDVGNRSRIVAVGVGTARVSAVDPETGVATTASGDDTVVTVTPQAIVRVEVAPRLRRVALGSSTRFVATGFFETGDTRNLTQRVEWRSSDSRVAVAANAVGDRSRVDTAAPGTVAISAYDPGSGVSSSDSGDDAVLTVEALSALTLTPPTVTLHVGESLSLTTVGTGESGASINVTQEATYASSDPIVVVATNEPTNKSRVTALAPGVATVTATRASAYPQATESNAITVTVLPAP